MTRYSSPKEMNEFTAIVRTGDVKVIDKYVKEYTPWFGIAAYGEAYLPKVILEEIPNCGRVLRYFIEQDINCNRIPTQGYYRRRVRELVKETGPQ